MCGIVGYLGKRQATEVLVEGLSKSRVQRI